jgi:hypothetical protein
MATPSTRRTILSTDNAILASLALLKLLLHLALNGRYNFYRDEYYFMACARHLDWGYVDIGPLTPWLIRLTQATLGDSVNAIRFFPALAGAATVYLTGLLARELGGKRFAQVTAALSILVATVWLLAQNILALPSYEPLFWVTCAWLIARIFNTGNTRLWLWVGVVSGFGLLNKPSMLFFGVALVIALALTPQRKQFASPWLYAGGLIAFLVCLPFLIWQIQHDWPTWQFLTGLNATLMARIPFPVFALGQIFYLNPVNFPLWFGGLLFFLFAHDGKPYRVFGIIYVVLFLFMAIAKSKIYYLSPAYPALLAGGALAAERLIERRSLRALKLALPAALLAGGAALALIALPILPIDRLDKVVGAITFNTMTNIYELTGTFHDMFGWEDTVAAMAKAYHGLPPDQRAQCILYGRNFGIAGAIDYYGPKYSLPPAVSFHQNYFFWGPPQLPGEIALAQDVSPKDLQTIYREVTPVATVQCPQCVPHEKQKTIYLCRGLKTSLKTLWPTLRPQAFRNG